MDGDGWELFFAETSREGRGRVGALGVERSREDAAMDGWVGALGAERSREDAAVHGTVWEL